MSVYIPMCPTCPQCVPYSELACISATLSMGFQLANAKNSGYDFLGNWGTKGLIVLRKFFSSNNTVPCETTQLFAYSMDICAFCFCLEQERSEFVPRSRE